MIVRSAQARELQPGTLSARRAGEQVQGLSQKALGGDVVAGVSLTDQARQHVRVVR
jgi:hypothetical protein